MRRGGIFALAVAFAANHAVADEVEPCDFEHDGVPVLEADSPLRPTAPRLALLSPGVPPLRQLHHLVAPPGKANMDVTVDLRLGTDETVLTTPTARLGATFERQPGGDRASLVATLGKPRIDPSGGSATGALPGGKTPAQAIHEASEGLAKSLRAWGRAPVEIAFAPGGPTAPVQMLQHDPTSLVRLAIVPLPEGPVGKGGTWRIVSRIESALTIETKMAYRWLGDDHGRPTIEISGHQGIPAGSPRRFRVPGGSIEEVERMENEIRGRVVLGRELPFASAEVTLESHVRFVKCRDGKREAQGMDMGISVRFDPSPP